MVFKLCSVSEPKITLLHILTKQLFFLCNGRLPINVINFFFFFLQNLNRSQLNASINQYINK